MPLFIIPVFLCSPFSVAQKVSLKYLEKNCFTISKYFFDDSIEKRLAIYSSINLEFNNSQAPLSNQAQSLTRIYDAFTSAKEEKFREYFAQIGPKELDSLAWVFQNKAQLDRSAKSFIEQNPAFEIFVNDLYHFSLNHPDALWNDADEMAKHAVIFANSQW